MFSRRLLNSFFKRKENVKLGFYGPPNSGKTSLANKICMDWTGEEIGKASDIPFQEIFKRFYSRNALMVMKNIK